MLVTVFIIHVNKAKCNKRLKCLYTIRRKYCLYYMTTVMTYSFYRFLYRYVWFKQDSVKSSKYFDYRNPALRLFHPNYA